MEADGRRTSDPVASYGWGKAAAIQSWLFAEGYRFDFFQAVRLLEMMQAADSTRSVEEISAGNGIHRELRQWVPPGEGADPSREIVRFSSAVNLDFPASDIAEVHSGNDPQKATSLVRHNGKESPAEMTVNFLGLAGGLGALDIPTTELILQRASRKDTALKDFLDIFNHRLISLLYRIRKHHRVGLGVDTPGEDQVASYLYSLIGLGTPNLHGRMEVRDRSLLYYAGILSQQPRSMVGLERILADYFQVEVKGHQFVGQWCDLEESQWSTIGATGENHRLGVDTIVGTRIWDQQARFEIHLGPLSLRQFISFLPTSWRFGVLCDLIRFYVKDQFGFSIRLILKATEVPGARLKSTHPELSWTSWLGGNGAPKPVDESSGARSEEENPYITISPESLRTEHQPVKSRVLHRLPLGKRSKLLGMMEKRSVPKSNVVMLQGEPGNAMFVIRSGKVQLSRRVEKGKERVIGILREGDSFGERALLMRKPYSETALTLTPCEISIIDRQQLEALAARYPGLRL